MERCREATADLHQSALMICEGDMAQFDILIKSPVSYYRTKLKDYINRYKAQEKEAQKSASESKKIGRKVR